MRNIFVSFLLIWVGSAHAATNLSAAIENVRTTCGGIGAKLSDMKKMAGITTAVTGVGTVAGGVALGTGIAKANVDKEITADEELISALESAGAIHVTDLNMFYSTFADAMAETGAAQGMQYSQQLKAKVAKLNQKSKTLGNVRTGTLAASTATNIAGAIMSGTNRAKGDLQQQIQECLASVKTLANVRMQAHIDGSADDTELARAESIIRACDAWSTVDISSINNRSTGATVSSGIGAGIGLAGTITSASANSDINNPKKEKNLNTTANVLAGGTTVASATATVFNATQINAIKRAATVADECEGVLK